MRDLSILLASTTLPSPKPWGLSLQRPPSDSAIRYFILHVHVNGVCGEILFTRPLEIGPW